MRSMQQVLTDRIEALGTARGYEVVAQYTYANTGTFYFLHSVTTVYAVGFAFQAGYANFNPIDDSRGLTGVQYHDNERVASVYAFLADRLPPVEPPAGTPRRVVAAFNVAAGADGAWSNEAIATAIDGSPSARAAATRRCGIR